MESPRITRRNAIGFGAGAALLVAGIAGSASAQSTPEASSEASPAAGGWEFTDDRGVTVMLDAAPQRIAGHARAAGALFDYGISIPVVLGTLENADGTPISDMGDYPPADVETWLGAGFDELDIEEVLNADPDVFITVRFPFAQEDSDLLWGIPNESRDLLESEIPIIAIDVSGASITSFMERFEELAVALGADPVAAGAEEDKAAFEAASADLEAALADKPDLSVTVFSAGETLYILNPELTPDLQLFQELGMNLLYVEDDPLQFQEVSWERLGDFSADLLLKDDRDNSYTYEQLAEEQPLWSTLPAVAAGQTHFWRVAKRPTYRGFVPVLTELVEVINESRDDVV